MLALFSFFIVLVLSMILTRVATVVLVQTGLPTKVARFQARSALTGCGFTTEESNQVLNHPIRRRIIAWLMVLGNAGIVTSVSTLILTFAINDSSASPTWAKLLLLLAGLLLLLAIASNKWVDRWMRHWIQRWLEKYTDIPSRNYDQILHLSDRFSVAEMRIPGDHWLCSKSLQDSQLFDEGLIVLGIERENGTYVGVPAGHTKICENDLLVIYGLGERIRRLNSRPHGRRGEKDHWRTVRAEKKRFEDQELKDRQAAGGS